MGIFMTLEKKIKNLANELKDYKHPVTHPSFDKIPMNYQYKHGFESGVSLVLSEIQYILDSERAKNESSIDLMKRLRNIS